MQSQFNEEQVNIRGFVEGEYTVNVRMYRESDDSPTKVEVALFKASTGDEIEESISK